MSEHVVASADELDEGDRILVHVEGRDIGVFNVGGEFYAHANWCPHHGGPVCEGTVDGTTDATFDRETLETDLQWVKEDEMLLCPWHAWEFDLTSGACHHSDDHELMSYPTRVEDGEVVVEL